MTRYLVLRTSRVSLRFHTSTVIAGALLALGSIVAFVISLLLPGAGLSMADALTAVGGDGFGATVIYQWRMPRALGAVIVGAALAVAGAIFQALTHNPLGSPDIIGFTTGSFTGALVVTMLGLTSFAAVAFGALVGGLITAVVVYLLSMRGRASGLRLIIVGLGVGAMLTALNRWLLAQLDLVTSMTVAAWGAGSLNGLTWPTLLPAAFSVVLAISVAGWLNRRLAPLALGDDVATSLGERMGLLRLGLLGVGVVLVAAATSAAGPISFVALAAPHLARGLTKTPRTSLVPVMLTGSLIVLLADIVAQRLFAPTQLPVGVVTVTLGGCYLVALLIKEAR